MSPVKMLVAKVITHRDFDRKLILALEEFGLLELMDVRHQAGIADIKKTREEQTVYSAQDRLSRIIEILGIDPERRIGKPVEIDDHTLTQSLTFVADVIKAIEDEVIEIEQSLAAAHLEIEHQKNTIDVARSLRPLGIDPSYLGSSEFTFTTAGVIPEKNVTKLEWSIREVTDNAFVFGWVKLGRGKAAITLSIPLEQRDSVERILTALEFDKFDIEGDYKGQPADIEEAAKTRIEELESELKQLENRRASITHDWGPKILAAWEQMNIEKQRIEVKSYFVYTEHSIKLWGWLPDGKQDALGKILRKWLGETLEVKFDYPEFSDVESPTYLDNPSYMRPTEDVVKAYGVPSKHDLDPTKIQWLTFPLIFGLIFADVGQGFIVLLIGIAALRARRRGDDWGQIMGYIQSGAEGLIMMGIFAMIGGLLFGSMFGAEVIEPLWPAFAHTINGEHNPYRTTHMLKLSIEIGAIQIALGIFLNLYNKLKHHDKRGAIIAFSYLWLYLGFINLLFGVSYSSIGDWFSANGSVNLWLPIIGIGYGTGNNGVYPTLPVSPLLFTLLAFIVPFVIMTIASLMGGMDGFVHFLEYAIGMISHTVSYARIFALNTVHMILSMVFFRLIDGDNPLIVIPLPEVTLFGIDLIHSGAVIPLIGAIVGTIIVGLLEGLLAFMHTLRLHMVEWYSKFYHAGGIEFRPFRAERVHTIKMLIEPMPVQAPVSI